MKELALTALNFLLAPTAKAWFIRVIGSGLGQALTWLAGLSIFAGLELPGADWVTSTAAFVFGLISTVLLTLASRLSTEVSK